jgi:hypothetical protein
VETIHLKTVDPISQELLRPASQRGIRINWERYERLQPQDGFLRLGLSCPFGCLQGPCRIDPFGRGANRGLCGLDRDGMVAAMLLRLSLHGALEAINDLATPEKLPEISWSKPLNEAVNRSLARLGGDSLSAVAISRAAGLLQRPLEPPERLILDALRLGILTLGLLRHGQTSGDVPRSVPCKAGFGLIAGDDLAIGICGQPDAKLIEALRQEISSASPFKAQLVSLGDWIRLHDGFLPCACTSGEAELLLSSGRIALLLVGPGADPSLPELCRELKMPLIMSHEAGEAGDILRLAREAYHVSSQATFNPDPSLVQEARVFVTAQDLEASLNRAPGTKLAVLGGSDTPQHALGWIPLELATALRADGYLVAGWGDAALWMLKNGVASAEQDRPVEILDPHQGPLLALEAMTASGNIDDLQGVCFAGVKACRDLAVALGLASLGVKVCVAVPLPVWGSEKVRNILADMLASVGGSLTHFDHPAQAQEILDWFSMP